MSIRNFCCWICSVIIDFLIIFLFVRVLGLLILSVGLDNENLMYFGSFLIYSIFSSINNGKSVGREWMRIKMVTQNLEKSKIKIFTHDFIFQWGLFFILPMNVFKYFTNANILIILIIFVLINILSWLIFKTSVLELFSKIGIKKTNKACDKHKINFALFLAFILDLTIVFSITLAINLFLLQWVFMKFVFIFLIVTIFYYLISYTFASRTFGKFFFGISINMKSGARISFKTILKREFLFKFGISCIIPILLMIVLGWSDVNILLTFIAIFNIIIAMFYYSCKKDLWWNKLANTKYTRRYLSHKNVLIKHAVLVIFLGLTYVLLLTNNNHKNNAKLSFLGFNFPFKKIEHPNNKIVSPYIDFLSANTLQNPKNYILSLFEKNDIVILCEANHLEDTQWDMIYSIVNDSIFIEKVGNIFTEYGNVKNQLKVDTFLKTNFLNDTSRYKSAATLMNYKGGGFYQFMNKLNKLNETLSDSMKVNLFFTDIMPWSYLIYDKPPDEQLIKRDSLMASVVIDWYRKNQKKCLVVTNYRHAFILNEKEKIQKSCITNQRILQTHFGNNEAQYIFDDFPNNTTNVMIYGDAYNFLFLPIPIQNGKWRTALNDLSKPVGFDFDNSPFGEDPFDFYPIKGRKTNLRYKDIFKGFVFYRAEEDHKFSLQLYSKYGAQCEYNEIIHKKNIDKEQLVKIIENLENHNIGNSNILLDIYLNWYYYIDILLFIFLTFISLTILLIDVFGLAL